jgi:hypothetical protein
MKNFSLETLAGKTISSIEFEESDIPFSEPKLLIKLTDGSFLKISAYVRESSSSHWSDDAGLDIDYKEKE